MQGTFQGLSLWVVSMCLMLIGAFLGLAVFTENQQQIRGDQAVLAAVINAESRNDEVERGLFVINQVNFEKQVEMSPIQRWRKINRQYNNGADEYSKIVYDYLPDTSPEFKKLNKDKELLAIRGVKVKMVAYKPLNKIPKKEQPLWKKSKDKQGLYERILDTVTYVANRQVNRGEYDTELFKVSDDYKTGSDLTADKPYYLYNEDHLNKNQKNKYATK